MDLNFEVIKRADTSRYANRNDIWLINLGPVALFSDFKMTKSSGKNLEEIRHSHIASLMYKLITSAKDSDDLSIGFEHQEKATYGLGYKRTLTRNKEDAVLQKTAALADARIKIYQIHWYVPHYTPFIQQQGISSKQILSKTPTELRYVERSVFTKEVKNQNLWNFELGNQESMNIPIWIIIGFLQQDRQDPQNLNKDSFCRLPVVRV